VFRNLQTLDGELKTVHFKPAQGTWLRKLYDHLVSIKIFTVIMNKISILTPKIMRQMANGYRHNSDSVLINYKFLISTRVVIEIHLTTQFIVCTICFFFLSIYMLLILATAVAFKVSAEQVPLPSGLAILIKTHSKNTSAPLHEH
jgi:hypothetical protein